MKTLRRRRFTDWLVPRFGRYSIATALLASGGAWAQPPRYPVCEPYTPPAQEVADVLQAAASEVPATARLYSSCMLLATVHVGPLRFEDTHVFRFEWPTGESFRNVALLRQATCTRTFAAVNCTLSPESFLRRSAAEVIRLRGQVDARELFDLLAFRDRTLSADYRIIEIRPAPRRRTGTDGAEAEAEAEADQYMLRGEYADGKKASYGIERSCNPFAECTWSMHGPSAWAY